jgi:hypothetical protein
MDDVDVDHAARQMPIRLHGSGMVAIFPVGAFARLATIELLGNPPGNQLHAGRDLSETPVLDQQMDMVRRHDIIQHTQAIAPARLIQPVHPGTPILGEPEQELLFVAAMRDMPDMTS